MARGCLYELTSSIDDVFSLTEYDLFAYDYEFEYIRLVENQEEDREEFLKFARNLGMETGTELLETGDGKLEVQYIEVSKDAKRKYFENRFFLLKEYLSEYDLDNFIDSFDAYKLSCLIDDTYADAVVSDYGFESLDQFMRSADGRYYLGKVYYMH